MTFHGLGQCFEFRSMLLLLVGGLEGPEKRVSEQVEKKKREGKLAWKTEMMVVVMV